MIRRLIIAAAVGLLIGTFGCIERPEVGVQHTTTAPANGDLVNGVKANASAVVGLKNEIHDYKAARDISERTLNKKIENSDKLLNRMMLAIIGVVVIVLLRHEIDHVKAATVRTITRPIRWVKKRNAAEVKANTTTARSRRRKRL